MTRASLLRILDHVNGISDDEIRELEQLAAAFPYCQTAHVLLAKTAHDRGSMLAGQRLRRAATYAADRELLRRLLERPIAPAIVATDLAASSQTDVAAATNIAPAALPDLAAAPSEPATDLFAVEIVAAPVLADETAPPTNKPVDLEAPAAPDAPASAPDRAATQTDADEELLTLPEPAAEPAVAEPVAIAEELPVALPEAEPLDANAVSSSVESEDLAAMASVIIATEDATDITDAATEQASATEEAPVSSAPTVPEASGELLPAVAPPIRPPSGAGISRFEFGLNESRLPEPTGYRLLDTGQEDEEFAAEEDELPTSRPAGPPRITAPFRADAELGYALGGGSRLGYDLQAHTPDGFTLDLPLEAFFEPDALLLAHARAHQPAPKASSLDLINRFLKAQPRIRAGAPGVPPPATEQADLSVRNSAAAPVLASESLAKIMIKQGKTTKAIEIYERLMTKQPEKMAYFAEQIQQLQQPPE
ncbi:hypothetical protein [Hymenobacter psychrophilus]|uniref:Uncharacterized protein n=1 Tax=Hymenobacter psychrophilus TaxID=651662 RepID=A0A1H3BQ64_9BACT|nr:hypothetical protein [Hymenobacter psychrophilus]SDX44112.1 hypothetical protein SAMN04488069_101381 [Hymenobacter psychrophilus]